MLKLRMMSSYQYVAMICSGIEVDELAHTNEGENVIYEYYVHDNTYEYDNYTMIIIYMIEVTFDGKAYEVSDNLNDSVTDVRVHLIESSMKLDSDAISHIEKEIANYVCKEASFDWEA